MEAIWHHYRVEGRRRGLKISESEPMPSEPPTKKYLRTIPPLLESKHLMVLEVNIADFQTKYEQNDIQGQSDGGWWLSAIVLNPECEAAAGYSVIIKDAYLSVNLQAESESRPAIFTIYSVENDLLRKKVTETVLRNGYLTESDLQSQDDMYFSDPTSVALMTWLCSFSKMSSPGSSPEWLPKIKLCAHKLDAIHSGLWYADKSSSPLLDIGLSW